MRGHIQILSRHNRHATGTMFIQNDSKLISKPGKQDKNIKKFNIISILQHRNPKIIFREQHDRLF